MEHRFSKVKLVMRPGFEKRCNYLSLHLPKFVKHCLRSLNIFNTMYKEIKLVNMIFKKCTYLIPNNHRGIMLFSFNQLYPKNSN